MGTTTIKVSTEVRDRLNAAAASRGLTPGALVQEFLSQYERGLWFEKIRTGYAALPSDDDYARETEEWDATLGDGLKNE